jgi:RNA polymerase sigma factor (sigma-70 family)
LNGCKNKRRSLDRLQRFDPGRFREERADFEGPPERLIDGRLLQNRIDGALTRLTEEQRGVLLLKAAKDLSYREIGELFGQSENQIRGKLYRARKAFRAALAEESDPGCWQRSEEAHAAISLE